MGGQWRGCGLLLRSAVLCGARFLATADAYLASGAEHGPIAAYQFLEPYELARNWIGGRQGFLSITKVIGVRSHSFEFRTVPCNSLKFILIPRNSD